MTNQLTAQDPSAHTAGRTRISRQGSGATVRTADERGGVMTALGRRLRHDKGSLSILLCGLMALILMVTGFGTALTGVHMYRNTVQYAADSAALAAAQAIDPSSMYRHSASSSEAHESNGSNAGVITPQAARESAQAQIGNYHLNPQRISNLTITEVQVDADGTVRVHASAHVHPPLVGWFTRGTGTAIPVRVTGEARAS